MLLKNMNRKKGWTSSNRESEFLISLLVYSFFFFSSFLPSFSSAKGLLQNLFQLIIVFPLILVDNASAVKSVANAFTFSDLN